MSTHVEGRREQARVGDMVAVGSKGVGHREGGGDLGVWRERVWCVEQYQGTAGIVPRAPEQKEVGKGQTAHRGRGTEDEATKVRGEGRDQEQCRKDPG